MSKQLVGYLLGHALCEGNIGSVGDTVQKYLKLTSGTPWGNKTLRQMINMQAGNAGNLFVKAHKTLWETVKKVKHLKSLKGPDFFPDYQKWDFLPDYTVLMFYDATTVKRSIKKAKGIREDETLDYNSQGINTDIQGINTDIVLNIIAKTTKGDTRGFIQKHLAERAGTTGEISFSKDRDGWLMGAFKFHATRKDWLRLGIMIAEDWKSDTCIGRYLRDIEKNKISQNVSGRPGRIYADQNFGGFFHFDNFYLNGRNASFVGHGGQRVIIDLDTGRVLALHAVTDDYDFQRMHDLFNSPPE